MTERFQVDLGGMVDLLSHHLYSGPQVFVRELLQNAVDAIAVRRELDAEAPATVRLKTGLSDEGSAWLEVVDTGIGMTADEARELLSTIGRSSKRDPASPFARGGFIGQFGVGLLATFMVADVVEVISRSATVGAEPIRWVGRSDGTFQVEPGPDTVPVGTTTRLVARADTKHWLETDAVLSLAAEYGSLLDVDIAVQVTVPGAGPLWRRVTESALPWSGRGRERDQALTAYCERTFGFTPLAAIPLELPLVGLSGVAFVLPQSVAPGTGQHRVYVKRMLVGQRVDSLLPDWAFFCRAVVNSTALSPTASREHLHVDETLLATREALAAQLKEWAKTTLVRDSEQARRIIKAHHLALRALAVTDDEMLDLVASVVPFETTDGPQTLTAAAKGGEVVYAASTEAYRRVASVARAHHLCVVNAGYVYDADLLARLPRLPGWRTRELTSDDLTQVLELPSAQREAETAAAILTARELLDEADCDVVLRTFRPTAVPAILLRDTEGEHRRRLDRERQASPDLWDGLLDSFATSTQRRTRTLVLNDSSSVVAKLLAAHRSAVFAHGLRALYLSALMLAGDGLRSAEVTELTGALSGLLDASLPPDQ